MNRAAAKLQAVAKGIAGIYGIEAVQQAGWSVAGF
jgi:hypothetical protein